MFSDTSNKSYGIGMGEAALLRRGHFMYHTLISGGAADCVIIAAYNTTKNMAYMVHAHRKTDLDAVFDQIDTFVKGNNDGNNDAGEIQIRLACGRFADENPMNSQLITNVIHGLDGRGYNTGADARITSTSLSLSADDGVFTQDVDASNADRKASDAFATTSRVELKKLSDPNASNESPF